MTSTRSKTRECCVGSSRKVGLRSDVHLCAFLLDPMAQAALTTLRSPDCDLLGGEIQEAARKVFRHAAGDDPAKAQVYLQQLTLYAAACPTKLAGMDEASPMGNNAYSSLVYSQMTAVWRLKARREADRAQKEGQVDDESPGFAIKEALGLMQLTELQPSQFWLAMARESPRGANSAAIEAHKLFCKAAGDICSIVPHTCGVERAGKGYGLVLTPLRKKMAPERARKCIYTMQNYPLLDAKQQRGDTYEDFLDGLLTEEERAAVAAKQAKGLRRGSLIINDAPLSVSDDSDSDDEPASRPIAIKWTVPDHFSVAFPPSNINADCIGRFIYLNWKDYGWSLGKVTELIASKSPRLFKHYNCRVIWAVEGKLNKKCNGPCKLDLTKYASGADAPLDSWVFLDQQGA